MNFSSIPGGKAEGCNDIFLILGEGELKIGRTCAQGHIVMLIQQTGIDDVSLLCLRNRESEQRMERRRKGTLLLNP